MKRTILNIATLALLVVGLTACEKAFYMPTAEVPTNNTNTEAPQAAVGVDIAKLNLVWLEPLAANANTQGVKFVLLDKDQNVVFNQLVVRAENDPYFRMQPAVDLNPAPYTFMVIDAAGNTLNQKQIDIAQAFNQDEYIVETPGMNYYLQMTWRKIIP